ncbi:MAG TPA: hypothetical protein VK206_10210, partial [Anaerolineales bacterium]|nr:hypothetical protein [Anaerolineales bacterium]
MNDEFMHQLYEEPRVGFADALYERISRQPQPRFPQTIATKLTFRNAAVAFMIMLLIAACVYAVTERGWHKVGGIWVDVERTYKPDIGSSSETSTEPSVQPQEPKCLTVEEAKKVLRFDLHVPAWAPEGFTLDDRICGVDELSDFASLAGWKGTGERSFITLMA